MATFSAVNTTLSPPDTGRAVDDVTPTTPKPNANLSQEPSKETTNEESSPTTPTRHSFGGLPGLRPLPDDPLTPAQKQDLPTDSPPSIRQDASHSSTPPQPANETKDIEMGEGDEDNAAEDENASDIDSVTSDSQRPSKKKKGQRFFCTDFPPCQLSFTRSEHLARHIRYDRPACEMECFN